MKTMTCNGYAIITYFFISTSSLLFCQSGIVYDAGTSVDIGLGADVCADTVIINGTYSGNGTICNNSIPVELVSFNASVVNNKFELNWKTATELNNYGFEIERQVGSQQSSAGNWDKIGFVEGSGNSTEPKDYSFTDSNPSGGNKFQYRLKQIDYDGKFEYSNIVEVNMVIDKFDLSQNYPNPFNPSTKISFSIPQSSNVMIKVFDILGNEIETLVNEENPSGSYEVIWSAEQLPSGVYFYQLKAGEFVEMKKMLLLK